MPSQDAINALSKAKIGLMASPDSAFFTTILFSLKQIWDDAIPTACTNGRWIRLNPDFFMKQNPDQRIGLLVHESMHPAYLHCDPTRRGGRDPERWNAAADYVINYQLISRGFKLPDNGLYDPQYAGMSVEQVYALLPQGTPCPMPDIQASDADPDQLQREVEEILVRASLASQMAGDKPGSIPAELEIAINRLLHPKLPWHRILQKWLNSVAKNDYSFRRPNRRYFPAHYLPSLHSENLVDLAIFGDVSGSMSDEEVSNIFGHTTRVLRMMKPAKIQLGQFNTQIVKVNTIRSLAELNQVTFNGRGGTRIEPVLEWAETNKPQVMLVFSDGHFHFHKKSCSVPVLWIIHNNPTFTAPFGKVVHYTLET
jgi:predicted metal-dependent peptidase